MKALVLHKPGDARIETVADPVVKDSNVLLKVRMVGFCGSDLNLFRGLNSLVSYPRILGHEVAATVVQVADVDAELSVGTDVAVSPYSHCGVCPSCRRGRSSACQFNQTLGVQRDGALTEFIVAPREKPSTARVRGESMARAPQKSQLDHFTIRTQPTTNPKIFALRRKATYCMSSDWHGLPAAKWLFILSLRQLVANM